MDFVLYEASECIGEVTLVKNRLKSSTSISSESCLRSRSSRSTRHSTRSLFNAANNHAFYYYKSKGWYSSSWGEPHLRATVCHLPYGITQCYLLPDTSERAPPNPSHAGWYSIYRPRRDGRLSWPSWLDSAPAGSRTSDLSITSPTPNHCTTKTTTTPTTRDCQTASAKLSHCIPTTQN